MFCFLAHIGTIGKGLARFVNDSGAFLLYTTDGKAQLRYLLGDDAKQTYARREQVGDDGFVADMRERMLS